MSRRVVIIGGGLAGLAAASQLAPRGFQVTLCEARRRLGGRAGSHRDPQSGDDTDHCQHVAMGCCTQWIDFCRRLGAEEDLERHRTLRFVGPNGRFWRLRGVPWLPAPLHLAPSLLRLGLLRASERISVGRALLRLAREPVDDDDPRSIDQWLNQQRQSTASRRRFWDLVLVSALSELPERIQLRAAQQVFTEGFLASRSGYELLVPRVTLSELYDQRAARWLQQQGAVIRLQEPVKSVDLDSGFANAVTLASGERLEADHVVLAAPWTRALQLIPPLSHSLLPELCAAQQLQPAPIAALHLWFDRDFLGAPHAVMVERLSQWIFRRPIPASTAPMDPVAHYQVVISAAYSLQRQSRTETRDRVLTELAQVWPESRQAKLLRWRLIIEPHAVFSPCVGNQPLRPPQRTGVDRLTLAGDWTQTGWPATMEGAVRSGYLAAEAVLQDAQCPASLLTPSPRASWFARWLIGTSKHPQKASSSKNAPTLDAHAQESAAPSSQDS